MAQELFIQFIVALLKLIAGIVLSIGAVYTSVNLLDRLTSGIDEWKEIKKGNLAIGLFMAAVMFSVILLTESRITDVVLSLSPDFSIEIMLKLLLITLFNYLLGLLAGVFVIFLSINLIARLTHDLDEFGELKKGNVAVALFIATALIIIMIAAKTPVEYAFTMLKSMETALL